jgi:tetratricopeptide (TPR) repeat protein
VVRLGARAVPIGEVLLAAGFVLAEFGGKRRRPLVVALAFLCAAAGASGLPAAAAFALPVLLALPWPALSTRALAAGLLVGAAASFVAPAPAAALATALHGGGLLAAPWRTGLIHPAATAFATMNFVGVGAMLALIGGAAAFARTTRRPFALVAAAASLLALAVAPALRVPRTGLELLGDGITPEDFLPAIALAFASCAGLCGETLVSKLPIAGAVVLTLVGAARQGDRFTDPIALIGAAIDVAPDQPELRVLAGEWLLRELAWVPPARARKLAADAVVSAELALRRRPDDPAAQALFAVANAVLGRLDEARRDSDRLLLRHPDDWRAQVARAEIEAVAGDEIAALRWLRGALQRHPDDLLRARYTALLDRIYERIRGDLADRRYAEVRARCEQIVAVAPEETTALLTGADTWRLAGDLPQAIRAFEAIYAERPHDRDVIQRLASVYDKVGDAGKAAYYKRLLLELPEAPKGPAR